MARVHIKEKKERALGTKLFLKAERCNSPKCVMVRRPHPPGMHGKARRAAVSEFGRQLREKQKIQIIYGLTNTQMKRLFAFPQEKIVGLLEKRLDRVVYHLGLAASPRIARQLVSHGHITVNGRKVTIPSYHVKLNDSITIRPESRTKKVFEDVLLRLKKQTVPSWLNIDAQELKGTCTGNPHIQDLEAIFNINMVNEFYSR